MTRLAFLSDIHGNLPALEAVMADMQQFAPDHVVVVGDLINTVPFDGEVMDVVVRSGWTAIRGNHEYYMLDYGTPREREGMRGSGSPAWLNRHLQRWYATIAAMPDQLTLYYRDAPPIFVTHGLPGNPFDAVTRVTADEKVRQWLQPVRETVYLSGHYHLSVQRQVGQWTIFNPGPVGAMMDGTHDAGYLLLDAAGDHWEPTFRRVPYDFARVEAAFAEHRLHEVLGVEGYLKCEQVRRARPTINGYALWMDRHYAGEGWSLARAVEYLSLPLEAVWDTVGAGYQVNPHIPLPPPMLPTLPNPTHISG